MDTPASNPAGTRRSNDVATTLFYCFDVATTLFYCFDVATTSCTGWAEE